MYVIRGCVVVLWLRAFRQPVAAPTPVPRSRRDLHSHHSYLHTRVLCIVSGTHCVNKGLGGVKQPRSSSPRQKLLREARVLNVSLPAAADRKSDRGQNRRSDADTGEHAADERKAADGRFADLPGRFGS